MVATQLTMWIIITEPGMPAINERKADAMTFFTIALTIAKELERN